MARQLSISVPHNQFRTDPTPDSAIAVHAQMLGFHSHDDAQSFRDEVLAKYPNDANLHTALASQLDEVGEYDKATPLFERAYQLDSSLPAARNGMALRKIVDNLLDDARQMLDFLERPGAGQVYPLGRLEQLAEAYQKAGRHEETLSIAEHLVRELPEVANHHKFRAFVRKSEKAAQRATPVLPPRKATFRSLFDRSDTTYSSGQRWAVFLTIAAVLIVAGLAILNEYQRQHRTVIVRNDFGPNAKVVIDGDLEVPPGGQADIVLGEGVHHVAVSGGSRKSSMSPFAATIGSVGPTTRCGSLTSAARPRLWAKPCTTPRIRDPPCPRCLLARIWCTCPTSTMSSRNAPNSITVDSKGGQVVKQRVSNSSETPVDVFFQIAETTSPEAALRYGESRLLIDPADDQLAGAYVNTAFANSQQDRAMQFLERQFDKRPVQISLHRMLHELHPTTGEKLQLIAKYDDLLAHEPNNAALLYLRGRLTPDDDTAAEYFNRAITADPQLSYPWMALGYRANTLGEWAKCKEYLQRANELKESKPDPSVLQMLDVARLAIGEGDEVEQECRDQLQNIAPNDAMALALRLSRLLAARGDLAGANQTLRDWEAKSQLGDSGQAALEQYRAVLEFMTGDLAATEARIVAGTAGPEVKFGWLILSDKATEASLDADLQLLYENPWNALALSLAFDLAGKAEDANTWRNRAADALAKLDFDEAACAELLRATNRQRASSSTRPVSGRRKRRCCLPP